MGKTPKLMLLVSVGSLGVHTVQAQTYTCAAPNSSEALALKDYALRLTGGDTTLARTRQGYQLPSVPASQVQPSRARRCST